MREMKFFIQNDFYIIEKRLEKSEILKEDNIVYYNTYEEALSKVEENLINLDPSSDIKYKEHKYINDKIQIGNGYSKLSIYNVYKYKHKLSGFTFNVAVVVWNKETNELEYKFIENEDLKKLIKCMPDLKVLEKMIEHYKKQFEVIKTPLEMKKFIINTKMFCNSFDFVFNNLGNLYNDYLKEIEDNKKLSKEEIKNRLNIRFVLDNVYNSYIGCHFKKNK